MTEEKTKGGDEKQEKINMEKLRYIHYPGCSGESLCSELMQSTEAVAEKLGIELKYLKSMTCCGANVVDEANPELDRLINARNFALAEKENADILTTCNTCLNAMTRVNSALKNDEEMLNEVNSKLAEIGLKYNAGVDVKHFIWVIVKDLGLDKLKSKVTKKLNGIKIAPFYGCHILRPPSTLRFEDPQNPKSMDDIIDAIGGTAVDFYGRTKCCGFHIISVSEDVTLKLTAKYLKSAKDSGADCMVTPCPMCHLCLDTYQKKAEKIAGERFDMPVFHLPQLIGLALGIKKNRLELSRHMISTSRIIKMIRSG